MKRSVPICIIAATLMVGSLTACSSTGPAPSSLPSQTAPMSSSAQEAPADSTNTKTDTAQYHKLTAEEAEARMDENAEVMIVDVRSQEEFDAGHIKGAILIPLDTISDEKPEKLPNLDDEILVYCRSGRRSKEAAERLVAQGYTKVYDMGGINDWPYEVITDAT